MKDVRMMVGRVEADETKYGATNQQHYQPQFEGNENFGRYQTHRYRQQEWHEITKFENPILRVH